MNSDILATPGSAAGGPIRQRRPRPQTSCTTCHRRKIKCDKELPCNQCLKAEAPARCTYASAEHPSASTPRPAFTRPQVERPIYQQANDVEMRRRVSDSPSDMRPTFRHNDGPGINAMQAVNESSSLEPFGSLEDLQGWRWNEVTIAGLEMDELEHRWPVGGPSRGRTHYSWSLQRTKAILEPFAQFDTKRPGGHHTIVLDSQLEGLIGELPSATTCISLTRRYFETFGTVYHIISKNTFLPWLEEALQRPEDAPVYFWVRALIVFAIGNATLPLSTAPITRTTSLRWLELASPTTTIALETSSEFDIEAIRTWTLINLARQLISSNDLADYVSAGGAVKAAMACGLHQSVANPFAEPAQGEMDAAYDRKMLFFASVDLDLSASITAGMVPTTDRIDESKIEWDNSNPKEKLDTDALMKKTLYLSLPTRYRILKHLNQDRVISSTLLARLSDSLSITMAPTVTAMSNTCGEYCFSRDYIWAMHQRYMFALERPLANELRIGGSLFSARAATDLARKRIADICTYWNEESEQSAMAALFMGYGVTARADVLHALCYLWWDIVRNGPVKTKTERVLLCIDQENSRQLFNDLQRVSHSMLRTHPDSWRLTAITEMALAHIEAVAGVEVCSPEYQQLMKQASRRIVDIIHSSQDSNSLHGA